MKQSIDPPYVLDCSQTPIPGSGSPPLQVIAELKYKAVAVHVKDGVGEWIYIFEGAVGFEEYRETIGGGSVYQMGIDIAAKARISLRSMSPSPITRGTLSLTFLDK